MAFIITIDHIATPDAEAGTNLNAPGVIGPRDVSPIDMEQLLDGAGHPFRMHDDDGVLYYEGRYLGDPDSKDAFEPLDCFGTPNAGAVRIEYRNASGEWATL